MYYFAFGIRRLHLPQIGFPLPPFPWLYTFVIRYKQLMFSGYYSSCAERPCINLQPSVLTVISHKWKLIMSAREKNHSGLLCYVTIVTAHTGSMNIYVESCQEQDSGGFCAAGRAFKEAHTGNRDCTVPWTINRNVMLHYDKWLKQCIPCAVYCIFRM